MSIYIQLSKILTTFFVAGIGPVPMTDGSTPACAHATILASGSKFLSLACLYDIVITAAAPSFIPDALPAVTVPEPSVMKQGLRRLRVSTVVPGLGNSSSLITVVPMFRRGYKGRKKREERRERRG